MCIGGIAGIYPLRGLLHVHQVFELTVEEESLDVDEGDVEIELDRQGELDE